MEEMHKARMGGRVQSFHALSEGTLPAPLHAHQPGSSRDPISSGIFFFPSWVFCLFLFFNWRKITLQCHIGFCHTTFVLMSTLAWALVKTYSMPGVLELACQGPGLTSDIHRSTIMSCQVVLSVMRTKSNTRRGRTLWRMGIF